MLRNDQENILGGGSFNIDGATIYEVEAMALNEGLSFALKKKVFLRSKWKATQD